MRRCDLNGLHLEIKAIYVKRQANSIIMINRLFFLLYVDAMLINTKRHKPLYKNQVSEKSTGSKNLF